MHSDNIGVHITCLVALTQINSTCINIIDFNFEMCKQG
ncbi:unnamed protein product [Brugia timori]|uniref:Uncharacterized protein n=1 Tax=Brugia timori TaxID=42155 RepID=A0A3P7WJJ8_9BILA|nr:unnamed protein product [Brugia timori]